MMSDEQPNNPLHGITLQVILEDLVSRRGWAALGSLIDIRCFTHDPSVKSSLKFLRANEWARTKVENLYLEDRRHVDRNRKRNQRRAAMRTHRIGTSDPLIPEALRIYRRYQREVVEALDFCPWAEHARLDNRVRLRVMPSPRFDLDDGLRAVAEIASDTDVDIGLLIYPRLTVSRAEFDKRVRELGNADDIRWPRGEVPMAMAAFHPEAEADVSDPARLVPFIRRSPDPTIQLVRLETLRRLRGTEPSGTGFVDPDTFSGGHMPEGAVRTPLHERVAVTNHATVKRLGVAAVEGILTNIRRDRDSAYKRVSRVASEGPDRVPRLDDGDGDGDAGSQTTD